MNMRIPLQEKKKIETKQIKNNKNHITRPKINIIRQVKTPR